MEYLLRCVGVLQREGAAWVYTINNNKVVSFDNPNLVKNLPSNNT